MVLGYQSVEVDGAQPLSHQSRPFEVPEPQAVNSFQDFKREAALKS
jgi:hypothetical protein